ncbi:MAG: GTPase [Haliea sp.]|nr:GTPase [Haliea sp.]
MSEGNPIKLRIPRQDLPGFSAFPLSADGARAWVSALPVANAREVALRLKAVFDELNRSPAAPDLRHQLLETLRPALQVATQTLSRRFLNQPLVLPEEPRQIAQLSDQLYGLAATGYTLVALHAIRDRHSIQGTNPARLACEALQRALCLVGCKQLQAFQLYQDSDNRAWFTLHQLYTLAERQQLTQLPVIGRLGEHTTITATYAAPLLLACCKPNQLRQSDLSAIHRGLREWSHNVRVLPFQPSSGLFAIDLDSDQPPVYASTVSGSDSKQLRTLDTEPLVAALRRLAERDQEEGGKGLVFDQDTRLHSNILQHVIESLSSVSMRNFNRSPFRGELWVGVGLSSAHYHCAGELTFEQVLHGRDYEPSADARVAGNPFLVDQHRHDPWETINPRDIHQGEKTASPDEEAPEAIPIEPLVAEELLDDEPPQLSARERYPEYRVQAVNASPGGYCLAWDDDLPGDIRTGDVLSLREEGHGNWLVAAIRWISSLQGAGTMVGVELLSPGAIPYGAHIQNNQGGESAPIRVLLLPEIKLVGQPNTLITPRSGFREGQKLRLERHGEELRIRLQRQLAATATFSQFDYRVLRESHRDEAGEADRQTLPGSPFKSLWTDI